MGEAEVCAGTDACAAIILGDACLGLVTGAARNSWREATECVRIWGAALLRADRGWNAKTSNVV